MFSDRRPSAKSITHGSMDESESLIVLPRPVWEFDSSPMTSTVGSASISSSMASRSVSHIIFSFFAAARSGAAVAALLAATRMLDF